MRITLLLSLVLMLFSACEESRTACLDFFAENYDLGAVEACDSCCAYPSFTFTSNTVFDTFNFSYNRFQALPGGDSIAIQDFELGFFNIQFVALDTSYNVINYATEDRSLVDNVRLYNSRASSTLNIGETNFSNDLSSIKLRLGIEIEDVPQLTNLISSSNWNLLQDSMYVDSIPLFNTFKMTYLLNDSIPHSISSDKVIDNLSWDLIKFVSPGQDWSLNMTLDFNMILKDINADLTESEVKEIIEENLSSLISIE